MVKLTDVLSELKWCKQRERACREALNTMNNFLSTDISEASTTLRMDDGGDVSQEAIRSVITEIESSILEPLQKRIRLIGDMEVDSVITFKEEVQSAEETDEAAAKPAKIGRRFRRRSDANGGD